MAWGCDGDKELTSALRYLGERESVIPPGGLEKAVAPGRPGSMSSNVVEEMLSGS